MAKFWQVFFPDRTDASHAPSIEQAALDYPPAVRRKIVAIIDGGTLVSPFPIETDIAFLAVRTRAWKRPPLVSQQPRKGARR